MNKYKIETYLNLNTKSNTLEDFVNTIYKEVDEKSVVKNAGHESKQELTDTLSWSILDYSQAAEVIDTKIKWKEDEIIKQTELAIKKCQDQIYHKDTTITIFPTFSDFVLRQMDGVSGFTPDKNVMNIFIHNDYNPETILGTVAHEYAHTISYNFEFTQNLLSSIVLEGLAEIFYEKITGKKSKYCQALNYEDSINLAKTLPLEKEGWDEVRELFTGDNKYPLWAGYSISYFLITEYLDTNNIEIEEALLINQEKIGEQIKNLLEH